MPYYLSPIGNDQQVDANGNPISGGKIRTYLAGTTTPATTYTSSSGGAQANPIILNSLGIPANPIWLLGGVSYKFTFTDSADVTTLPTVDNIVGVNDSSVALSQWTASNLTPTYISTTSFSVTGDQTPTLQVGRRLQLTVTAGTVYGTIATSVFGAVTTVTLTMDAGQTLDSGLSSFNMGIITPQNTSAPTTLARSGANADITSMTGLTGAISGPTAITGATAGAAVSNVASINAGALAGLKNALINPAFWINQELPTSNADDTYAHDGWYVLTQTGAIAVSTLTDQENTTPYMARLTQSQAAAQRMGYAQIIKGQDCKHLRGQQITFRFGRTRLSSSANVRIAVLEWTGTEDSVTSDVVLDWTSSTYTAGNFFLAANLTVSAVVQQALTAATLTTGSSVTATLGSTFNNLIVFAWTEATAAQNVTLDFAKAQIETGALASNFEQRPFGLDLQLCQRYYWKTYNLGTAPLTATTTGSLRTFGDGAGNGAFYVQFPVEFHATPTLTFGNPNSGASGSWRTSGGADVTPTASGTGTRAAGFTFAGAGASNSLFGHLIAEKRL